MKRHTATIIKAFYRAVLQFPANLYLATRNSYDHHNCRRCIHFIF